MGVIEVTEATFRQDVLERSYDVPVVVDFWAEWCGPCRSLGPILERLATEADGAWVLAKVDVDSNQQLAAAAGVQGIPAVRAFKDGKQVAEFVGALPETEVRTWLAQLGPSPADLAYEDGALHEANGDLEAALTAYRKAQSLDPSHVEAKAGEARVSLAMRSSSVDEKELAARLATEPLDVEAAKGLADVRAARGDLEGAFDVLLDLVAASSGAERDAARVHLLSLMDAAPAGDQRVVEARKRLGRLLF